MKDKANSKAEVVQILIVEDSPTQAEMLRYTLEKNKYKVTVAKDGKIALALIPKIKPSLVISDIVMPEMNGFELCNEIKSNEKYSGIPVILLTSLSNSEDVLEGLACGADNFLTKPYREEYLISLIEQILANKEISKGERVRVGVEISFGGKKRFITANQQQMLSLLISTYDAAVQKNKELIYVQEELKSTNEHLEESVAARTAELLAEVEVRKSAEKRVLKLNRVYAVLSNINQAIVRIHETDELLRDACLIAIDEGKFQSAWIGKINYESNKITLAANAGTPNNLIDVSPNDNPIVNAIRLGRHCISNDIKNDSTISDDWKKSSVSLGFNSFAAFPLKSFDKVIGGFAIYSNEVDFFDEIEIALLDEMAIDISFALEYIQKEAARKHAEEDLIIAKEKAEKNERSIREQKEEIELNNNRLESLLKVSQYSPDSIQELLDFALNEAISLTNSQIGYIYFYNESTQQFILNTWSKEVMNECQVLNSQTVYDLDKTGCWGETVRQRRPIIINDYTKENPLKKGTPEGHVKLKKILTIPVIFENKIVAVAGVANKLSDYDNTDIRQLTLLMDNVWKYSERITLIENLKLAKQKAEESDRLKTAFLHNISHEVRTPMNAIIGFSEFLIMPDLPQEKRNNFIDIIVNSCHQLLSVISDIISISTIEAGQQNVTEIEMNLNPILNQLQEQFLEKAQKQGIALILKNLRPDDEVNIMSDDNKLAQILSKLIDNAVKFTKQGYVNFGYKVKGTELEFFVEDTGIGIPQEMHQEIFNRFSQVEKTIARDFGGSGLGLSISKAYIELLGGKVWLTSELGKGSTFYFTIPYKKAKTNISDSIKTKTGIEVYDKAIKTILIAEDEESNFFLLEEVLSSLNLSIIWAKNGEEAIDICKTRKVDLVLMDVKMPVINGFEATMRIKDFKPNLPIIAQTAYSTDFDKRRAFASGCNDYISKPIKKDLLIAKIKQFLA